MGDLQVFEELNSRPFLQIYQLWYRQELFGNKVIIKIGKVDANRNFDIVTNGQRFINPSATLDPTLFVLPTTPAPMAGVSALYQPNSVSYARFGTYDANRSDSYLIFVGKPQNVQSTSGGALLIGESGLTWTHLPALRTEGDFRVGFWGYTGRFKRFNGNAQHGTAVDPSSGA